MLTGYKTPEAFEAAAKQQHDAGGVFLMMMPLVDNVPTCDDGVRVACPSCGQGCWKRSNVPDPLPVGVALVCTSCALRGLGPIKVFDADGAGEEWFAARSAEEAAAFARKEYGHDIPVDRFIELNAAALDSTPFAFYAADGVTVLSRTFAEELARSIDDGMKVPCIFATMDWR